MQQNIQVFQLWIQFSSTKQGAIPNFAMNPHFVFPQEKFFAIPLSGNMVISRSSLLEVELNEYLDIKTSKAQIISAFETCLLVHTLIVVCFEDDALLKSPAPLLNKVEALDEDSVSLKNEIGVSFGNLSICLVPSTWEKRAVITCNPTDISLAQTLHLALWGSPGFFYSQPLNVSFCSQRSWKLLLYIFCLDILKDTNKNDQYKLLNNN